MVLKLSGYERRAGGFYGWLAAEQANSPRSQWISGEMRVWGYIWWRGRWSEKAAEEAKKILGPERVKVIDMRVEIENVRGLNTGDIDIDTSSRVMYVYYCDNETVDGIELPHSNYFQSKAESPRHRVHCGHEQQFHVKTVSWSRGPTGIIFLRECRRIGCSWSDDCDGEGEPAGDADASAVLPFRAGLQGDSEEQFVANTPRWYRSILCGLVLKDLIRRFNGGGQDWRVQQTQIARPLRSDWTEWQVLQPDC